MDDQAYQYISLLYSYLNGDIDIDQFRRRSDDFEQASNGDAVIGIDPAFLSAAQRERMNRLIQLSDSAPPGES